MTFLFVGERPSRLAVKIGACWQNGKLAAKQLHDALRSLNIDPTKHEYLNLWNQPEPGTEDSADEYLALERIEYLVACGYTVVGMGAIVQRVLTHNGITHLALVHPAARGAIRLKERYAAHVQSVLLS